MSDDLMRPIYEMQQNHRANRCAAEEIDAIDQVANHIEAQAAEITRLRAELATARWEGMEEAAKIAAGSYPDESRYDPRSPLYGMDLNPDRSEFGRGKEAGRKEAAAAIRAAAKEGKP